MKPIILGLTIAIAVSSGVQAGGNVVATPSLPGAVEMPATVATPLKTGDLIPDMTLTDQNGNTVRLRETGGKPTVVVFYRGYWCPYCARHLSELRSLVRPGDDVRLLAVSIDPAATSKQLAERIGSDGKGPVSYPILSDPGHKLIDAFGIRNVEHDGQQFEGIPYPAVYVADGEGRITWAVVEFDYKKRPTNDEIRAAVDALK